MKTRNKAMLAGLAGLGLGIMAAKRRNQSNQGKLSKMLDRLSDYID